MNKSLILPNEAFMNPLKCLVKYGCDPDGGQLNSFLQTDSHGHTYMYSIWCSVFSCKSTVLISNIHIVLVHYVGRKKTDKKQRMQLLLKELNCLGIQHPAQVIQQ